MRLAVWLCVAFVCMLSINGARAELVGRKSGETDLIYFQRVLPVGTRVLAKFFQMPKKATAGHIVGMAINDWVVRDKYFYKGTVTETRVMGTQYQVYVQYDDGDKGWVPVGWRTISVYQPFSQLTKVECDAHYTKEVLAQWDPSKKYWYLGTITNKDGGNRYFVNYADGDTRWHDVPGGCSGRKSGADEQQTLSAFGP